MLSNKFSNKFQQIIDVVTSLGCNVKVVKPQSQLLDAPFSSTFGVNYAKKIVYITETEDADSIGGFIHEAGHVLACANKPASSNEFDFLGWEIALAMHCDVLLEWFHGQRDYVVDANDYGLYTIKIETLSDDKLSELVEERLDYARSVCLIDNDDRPLSIR